MTPQLYGEKLAAGEDLSGSANLSLARAALEGLIDPDTRKGQPGGWLLYPFHESLLWYDARRQGSRGRWGVRRVWMRGSGVTLARLLVDPPGAGAEARSSAQLPCARCEKRCNPRRRWPIVADHLERPIREDDGSASASRRGGLAARRASSSWAPLPSGFAAMQRGIMRQGGASGPAEALATAFTLWRLIWRCTRSPWRGTRLASPPKIERYLLLSFAGPPARRTGYASDQRPLSILRGSECARRSCSRSRRR